jgi:hypothetical protein
MIFTAENISGFYKIAMVTVDDGEGTITEDWRTIPETQTIEWAREGAMVTFLWPSVPNDQAERFQTCAEFRGLTKAHMLALNLETARKCIKVYYGEDETSTLDEYVKAGKDTALITSAPELAGYYKAAQ